MPINPPGFTNGTIRFDVGIVVISPDGSRSQADGATDAMHDRMERFIGEEESKRGQASSDERYPSFNYVPVKNRADSD